MPPKQRTPAASDPITSSTPARSTKSAGNGTAQDILQGIYSKYVSKTPQRVKLLDTFMAFLVVVGALQFFYVVLVGNFVRTPTIPVTPIKGTCEDKKSYRAMIANS
jgi:oligosaccharyltransferase complex subunit epsilon